MGNLVNLDSVDLVKKFEDSVDKLTESIRKISTDPDTKFGVKVDYLMTTMIALVPVLMNELKPDKIVDEARSDQVMRINTLLSSIQNSMYKKREIEVKEEIDVAHPKFQKVMEFMVEAVLEAMEDIGIDGGVQSSFIHKFSTKMVGFEDLMNKRLKGLSFQDLDTVENPLIKTFNDVRKSDS